MTAQRQTVVAKFPMILLAEDYHEFPGMADLLTDALDVTVFVDEVACTSNCPEFHSLPEASVLPESGASGYVGVAYLRRNGKPKRFIRKVRSEVVEGAKADGDLPDDAC